MNVAVDDEAAGRRVLVVGHRRADGLWKVTLIDTTGWRRYAIELNPVGSWHDVVDTAVTFDVDETRLAPGVRGQMVRAGVGPDADHP